MAERKNRNTWLFVILVVAVLGPLVLFSSSLKPWVGDSWTTTLIHEVSYPVEYAWFASTTAASDLWRHYVRLTDTAIENDGLKRQISEQKARTSDYDEKVLEINRLRELLGFAKRSERRLVVAEIVSSARSVPFHILRISRGDRSGVRVGMPVLTPDGVVGKVIRSGSNFSDVQLLTDTNFHLDVLLQRTRVRGVLRGLSGTRCLLSLNRKADIRIGDTLVTSGIVGGFYKGIPVGQVVKISYESDHVSQTVTVEPWVDHRRVDEVFVVESDDPELSKIIETAGFDWLEQSLQSNRSGGG